MKAHPPSGGCAFQRVKEPANRQNGEHHNKASSRAKSRDLRIERLLSSKILRRFLDSLRSLEMTPKGKLFLLRKHFDLLRNSPLSSIHIHFGGELLVLAAPLTSGSLSKNTFFDRLRVCCKNATDPKIMHLRFLSHRPLYQVQVAPPLTIMV